MFQVNEDEERRKEGEKRERERERESDSSCFSSNISMSEHVPDSLAGENILLL